MCFHSLSRQEWADVFVALEREASSAYILRPDLSVVFVNSAWRSFAHENGAPDLADGWLSSGPITRAMAPSLRSFFSMHLGRALTQGVPWSHTYECSRPGLYRRFNMRACAGPDRQGLIVVHSLVSQAALSPESAQALERTFTDARGLIVRCAACGRTARPGTTDSWEWVPGLDRAHNVSSGICAICSVEHYGFCS